ncbi:MAG: SufD family Fe-S cluster assembly protein [Candidatus Woesearchaeota archaeon]
MPLQDYTKTYEALMQNAPAPQFKHGLRILVKPTLSFEEIQEKVHASKMISKKGFSVSVDGELPKGVQVITGEDVFKPEYKRFLNDFFSEKWEAKGDALYHFNYASLSEMMIVIFGDDCKLTSPLRIAYMGKTNKSVGLYVTAGKNSTGDIYFVKQTANDEALYLADVVRISGAEGSAITFMGVQNCNQNTVSFQDRRADVGPESTVIWREAVFGGLFCRAEMHSFLNGSQAKTDISGVYFCTDSQRVDMVTTALHNTSETFSNILTRGAINKKAKALSRGYITIGSEAPHSEGYEKQEALLLHPDAEADAVPNLEIHNNEVKCSHGSTVGKIDQESLFYLQSRGLTEADAKHQIIEGFFAPILHPFGDEELNNAVSHAIREGLR